MLDPNQEGFAKLQAKIDALEVGMLTTADRNGLLRSRPMATQKVANGRLYFFTSKASPKQSEINEDASVNISYADPESQVYVSVSGKAAVSTAAEHIREAWTESARRWFPEGPQDPNLALLTVEISQAEFWDVDTKAMASLVDRSASAEEIIAATDHRKLA